MNEQDAHLLDMRTSPPPDQDIENKEQVPECWFLSSGSQLGLTVVPPACWAPGCRRNTEPALARGWSLTADLPGLLQQNLVGERTVQLTETGCWITFQHAHNSPHPLRGSNPPHCRPHSFSCSHNAPSSLCCPGRQWTLRSRLRDSVLIVGGGQRVQGALVFRVADLREEDGFGQ